MPHPPTGKAGGSEDILIEFITLGGSVRVTAIHAATGTEAVIVGPATAPRDVLETAAVRKLAYVMEKGKVGSRTSGPDASD